MDVSVLTDLDRVSPKGNTPPVDEIRQQLYRIVGSAAFRDSLRLTRFLTFIVETTLAGHGDKIKAYTVAVEALSRGTDFDPQTDPIVRVEAGRLRSALARYYSGEGQNDPLVIELPRGAYVPTFGRRGGERTEAFAAQCSSREPGLRSDRPTEISSLSRQLRQSLAISQELLKIHRLQVSAVVAQIASARRALKNSRALLSAADNFALADRRAAPLSELDAPRTANAIGTSKRPPDSMAGAAAAFRTLDEVNTKLSSCRRPEAVAEVILDATMRLHRSDFGSVQLFDEKAGELVMSAQRGFSEEFLRPFKRVRAAASGYVSSRAVRARASVILNDVFDDAEYAALRRAAAEAGYRAVQSTPLIAGNGRLVGMVSTHFVQPHSPSRFDMLMTQLYARLAADVITRLPPPDWHKAPVPAYRAA